MGKLTDYLMHPVSQLVFMVSAFTLIGFLLNVPTVDTELSTLTVTPENGPQITYALIPTILPTSTDWPTVTALPSTTPLPTATLIPTSTPWPTDTPTLLPTDTLQPAPTDTATLIPWPPTATPRIIVPEPPGAICPCHNGDVASCRDFRSQEDAQACYAYCVGQGVGDVHGLDEGFNNRACIYLPAATAVFVAQPVIQPVVPTATSVIAQATATPIIAQPTIPSVPTPTESEKVAIGVYIANIVSISDSYVSAFNQIAILFDLVESNPSIVLTDSWRTQVALQLALIKIAGDNVRSLQVPAVMQPVHNTLLVGVGHYDTATVLVAEGIDEFDIQKLEQADQQMSAGNDAINAASQLLEQIKISWLNLL